MATNRGQYGGGERQWFLPNLGGVGHSFDCLQKVQAPEASANPSVS